MVSVGREDKSRAPGAFAAGAVVVLLFLGGLFWLTRATRTSGSSAARHLPFGSEEQAVAQHVHFLDLSLSQASNFLNQDVTYISGVLSNDSVRTLRNVEVTLEFRDSLNQVVLRETRRLFGERARPLGGGERRDFQIALDWVPSDWNRQYPSLRVTGVALE